MSIPLDNLYHFIEGLSGNQITLYLFFPHGSKKITDMYALRPYSHSEIHLLPKLICHDQEPLCYANYTDDTLEIQQLRQEIDLLFEKDIGLSKFLHLENLNLATALLRQGLSIYDNAILLHSEKNSRELELYESHGFVGAYYWSHAVLARDWYRYAQYDQRLDVRNPENLFLIYSRGFTGSREYRLKFIEKLVNAGILNKCQISMLKYEQETKVQDYQSKNQILQVNDTEIFDLVPDCTHSAAASADYDFSDFEKTLCSVVLETEFDGDRIHLTEKILRPIACGHPFLLAAGPGSLEFLKHYGFRTFSPYIDESYDQETNSVRRLDKIVKSMQKIYNMPWLELRQWLDAVQEIANYNRQHFFSKEFFAKVCSELHENLDTAISKVSHTRGSKWLKNRALIRQQQLPGSQQQLKRHNEIIKLQKLRRLRSATIDQ